MAKQRQVTVAIQDLEQLAEFETLHAPVFAALIWAHCQMNQVDEQLPTVKMIDFRQNQFQNHKFHIKTSKFLKFSPNFSF